MSTTSNCDEAGSLHRKTRQLLTQHTREKSLIRISEETGLPFYWLKKFQSGEIGSPGVDRIQKLFEKLSGKTLPL